MTSAFASYFLLLALVANLFYFKTCLCVDAEGEALIAGICKKVQDPTFCLNTFHQNIPNHPYTPTEVTRVAISQSLQHATDNRIFIEKSKASSKDTEIQNLYAICDSGYGFLSTELQDASLSLAQKNYNALENSISKCPKFVSDCHDAFGDKTTPDLLDRNRKQLDLVLMANFAEGLIQK
ncbi:PREDICTED: uncharacterized protein LOC109215920 [Nicotiana attenuata]|uniref:Pectinesterase inhibitor domain-containing protein n=1 Tax=Nicotiana attenuata TaxID=49451 RepID=A0A1J6KV26_NICAT|nr:PREDICTED: uncharacterized protein LOC109215920 [Nicotiana attenuata]OIT25527.1 hypothetical protein A4A49_54717 [Nicotiana attenuata]